MATQYAYNPATTGVPQPVFTLGTDQTGNGDTTDILDRGSLSGGGAVVVTSTVGATPTVKIDIQGSFDGTNWYNIPYALVATPRTFVVTQITITTATTNTYILQEGVPYRYLKVARSANTNVTLTTKAYVR